MEIALVVNWEEIYKPDQAKVYPVGQRDKELIDMAFDKLRKAGLDGVDEVKQSFWLSLPRSIVWKNFSEGAQAGLLSLLEPWTKSPCGRVSHSYSSGSSSSAA